MDWHVDSTDRAAVASLRRDLVGYLRRHGERGSDFEAAGAALDERVASVAAAAGGPAWVHLDWSAEGARLEVVGMGGGPEAASSVALPVRRRRGPGMTRPPRHDLDSLPAPEEADDLGAFGR